MTEVRKTTATRIVRELGCVFWPIGIGLVLAWWSGPFDELSCLHVVALVAFGVGALGFRFVVIDRLRLCPHGVRGAVASPSLCAACLARKKAREHAEKHERKRRARERATIRVAGSADR